MRAGGQFGPGNGERRAAPEGGLLLHRRRDPQPGRSAARRCRLRQQPLHRAWPADAPGLRGHRHGRGARRTGPAGSGLPRSSGQRRRHHHQRRRQRGRGRLHQGHDAKAGRCGLLEDRHAAGPADGGGQDRQVCSFRPTRQSGGRDGHLPGLRAPCPAAHDGRQRAGATAAARTQPGSHAQEARASPATRARACSRPWSRPTA